MVLNYLADAYPKYAASVLAGNDFMRCAFAAGFPLFGTALYHNLGVGWASTLLALLLCAFIPMPIFLHFYGERIRFASKRVRRLITKRWAFLVGMMSRIQFLSLSYYEFNTLLYTPIVSHVHQLQRTINTVIG